MYGDRGAWHALLALLARTTARYLNLQIAAGAQAVQLFDSWVGALGAGGLPRRSRCPHTRALIAGAHAGHARHPLRHRHGGAAGGLPRGRRRRHRRRLAPWTSARPGAASATTSAIQGNLDPGGAARAARRDPPAGRRTSWPRPPAGPGTSSTSATASCPRRRSTTRGRSSTPSMSCPSARRRLRVPAERSSVKPLVAFGLWSWIEEHRRAFEPPVGNKVIWEDSQFTAMVDPGTECAARLPRRSVGRDLLHAQGRHDARVPARTGGAGRA